MSPHSEKLASPNLIHLVDVGDPLPRVIHLVDVGDPLPEIRARTCAPVAIEETAQVTKR